MQIGGIATSGTGDKPGFEFRGHWLEQGHNYIGVKLYGLRVSRAVAGAGTDVEAVTVEHSIEHSIERFAAFYRRLDWTFGRTFRRTFHRTFHRTICRLL